jgi:hypothetical protein
MAGAQAIRFARGPLIATISRSLRASIANRPSSAIDGERCCITRTPNVPSHVRLMHMLERAPSASLPATTSRRPSGLKHHRVSAVTASRASVSISWRGLQLWTSAFDTSSCSFDMSTKAKLVSHSSKFATRQSETQKTREYPKTGELGHRPARFWPWLDLLRCGRMTPGYGSLHFQEIDPDCRVHDLPV